MSFDWFVVPLLSQANYFYGQYSRGSVALPAGMPRICDVLYNGWQTVHIIKINSITINNKYTTKREITCLCCVFSWGLIHTQHNRIFPFSPQDYVQHINGVLQSKVFFLSTVAIATVLLIFLSLYQTSLIICVKFMYKRGRKRLVFKTTFTLEKNDIQ